MKGKVRFFGATTAMTDIMETTIASAGIWSTETTTEITEATLTGTMDTSMSTNTTTAGDIMTVTTDLSHVR